MSGIGLGITPAIWRKGGAAAAALTFPTTGILDSFTRANETPLSVVGNWHVSEWWWNLPDLVSNRLQQSATGITDGYGGMFWGVSFTGAVEFYLTLPVLPALVLDIRQYVDLELLVVGSEASVSGYLFRVDAAAGNLWQVWRQDGGGATGPLVSVAGPALAATDRIGYSWYPGGLLVMWHRPTATGVWVEIGRVTDATHTGPWYLELGIYDGTVRIDDIGGGTVV